ncbi:MAG: InlB B-repeat-containing protein [Bacteroidales bacterium]|nr:InlB B-repeat-containing protein [Bacteroidales bacterium]
MKVLKCYVIAALLIVVATMHLSSCSDDEDTMVYTISYRTEYSKEADKNVEEGHKLTEKELPVLQYKDYEFLGWYIGNEKITIGYVVKGNMTLTAKWELPNAPKNNETPDNTSEEEYYQITFTTDKGVTPQSTTLISGYIIKNGDLPELSAEGYVFEGWYFDEQKVEADYIIQSDMDLTAHWEEKVCKITYKTMYGKIPNPVIVPYNANIYDYLPILTASGHVFEGWKRENNDRIIGEYREGDFLDLNNTDAYVLDDCVLIAKWYDSIEFQDLNALRPYFQDLFGKRYRTDLYVDYECFTISCMEIDFTEYDNTKLNFYDSEERIVNDWLYNPNPKDSRLKINSIWSLYFDGVCFSDALPTQDKGNIAADIYDLDWCYKKVEIFWYINEMYCGVKCQTRIYTPPSLIEINCFAFENGELSYIFYEREKYIISKMYLVE